MTLIVKSDLKANVCNRFVCVREQALRFLDFSRCDISRDGRVQEFTEEAVNMGNRQPYAFTIWMAGGGVKPGVSYGATDEFGCNVTEKPVHVHDFQATLMHLLGVDHEQLTYRYQGRRFRLTDVHGHIIKDILA